MLPTLILFTVAAAQVPFPPLPQQYSATISVNYLDLGFTVAYNEFFDGLSTRNGTLYIEGRFGNIGTASVVDYNSQMVTEWTANKAVCYTTPISQLPYSRMVSPSIQFFFSDTMGSQNFTYLGQIRSQTETRGILCDKWQILFNFTFNNSDTVNISVNYYFAANGSFFGTHETGKVPVRVWATGTRTALDGTVFPFERVYDWVGWNSGVPPGFLFQLPPNCKSNPNASLVFTETMTDRSTVAPLPTNPPLPIISPDFRMLVEVKIREDGIMSDITTVNWWRDRTHKSERIDLFKNGLAQSLVYVYQTAALYDGAGYMYNNSGSQCLKLAVYDQAVCASSSCTTSRLAKNKFNPLFIRDGGFSRMFDNGSWFTGFQYQGRSPARGVNADLWTKYLTRSSPIDPDMTVSYQQSVYFFPSGWQFPGRRTPPNTSFPVRVINEGQVTCLTGSRTCLLQRPLLFSDMYDVYQYEPGVPSALSLQLPCPKESCWDGIQNQGEAGIDCGEPCGIPCPISPDSLPFPSLPRAYITSLSINVIDKGYTLSFNEYFDGDRNKNGGSLLTEGYYADLRQLQLIDYQTRKVYRWTPGVSCLTTDLQNVPGYNDTGFLEPSANVFARALQDVSAVYYYGLIKSTPETRGILCNKWETVSTTTVNGIMSNVSMTYYFSANGTMLNSANVPIRVWRRASKLDITIPNAAPEKTETVYDWTDWQNVKPPAWIFNPPGCSPANNFSKFDSSFNGLTYQVVSEPLPNTLMYRPFPTTFRMVVEAKLNQAKKATAVWSANWFLDVDRERLDLQPQGERGSNTLFYIYKDKTKLWDGSGMVDNRTGSDCYKIAFDNSKSCSMSTCQDNAKLDGNNTNPLVNVRDGGFARLFGPDRSFFAGSVYLGRRSARGIMADCFLKQQNRTVRGVSYDYQQYVFYFPEGWQFPGRAPYSTSLPLRVINEGRMTQGNESTDFQDVFDMFQLRPGSPPASTFTSLCETPAVAEDNSPSVGRVVGGFVVAILIAVMIGAIIWWIRKRRAKPAEQPGVEVI